MKIYYFLISILITAYLFSCNSNQEHNQKEPSGYDLHKLKKSGIGVITIKEEALSKGETTFDFFNKKDLSSRLGKVDYYKIEDKSIAKPIYYKPDANICYFICTGWDPQRYYVLANPESEEESFLKLDTTLYRFIPWDYIILSAGKVIRVNPENNPVIDRPSKYGKEVDWHDKNQKEFIVKEIYKKWVKVQHAAGQEEGWIVWVDNEKFWIDLPKPLIQPLGKLQKWKDPSAQPQNFQPKYN
ncbi:MAG: hypothetical protein OHK0053_27120 [Microscillaceae bacterium]